MSRLKHLGDCTDGPGAFADGLSRREMMKGLGALGLVGAGLAVTPLNAGAQPVITPPSGFTSPRLTISRIRDHRDNQNATRMVGVSVKAGIAFTLDDVNRMKEGAVWYRVSCEIWEMDRPGPPTWDPHDLCFTFRQKYIFPVSTATPARSANLSFLETHDQDVLDHDSATQDDIQGLLKIESSAFGRNGPWSPVVSVQYYTNKVSARF